MIQALIAIAATVMFFYSVVQIRIAKDQPGASTVISQNKIESAVAGAETVAPEEKLISSPTPSATPIATTTPLSTLTPEPTNSSTMEDDQDTETNEWLGLIYPGARLLSQTADSQSYEVNSNIDTVGDWYKQMLKQEDFQVKNFVKTTTNDHTQIMIDIANSDRQFTVQVLKKTNETTLIEIKFS